MLDIYNSFIFYTNIRKRKHSTYGKIYKYSTQIDELEKIKEDIKNNVELKQSEIEKIIEETTRLTDELKKAKTKEDVLKALSRTENELERMNWRKELNKLSESFCQNDMTSDIGEAIKNDNITDMKQALEQLMQQIEKEEISKEELAKMFKQIAEQAENNEVMRQLKKTAELLEESSQNQQQDALDNNMTNENEMQNLAGMLSDMMKAEDSAGLNNALKQLSQAIQQSKSNIVLNLSEQASGQNLSQNAGQNSGQSSGQSSAQNPAQNSGQNSGQQNNQYAMHESGQESMDSSQIKVDSGAGQNTGSGQGTGTGEMQGQMQSGGNGKAGEGSTNKDLGYSKRENPASARDAHGNFMNPHPTSTLF